MITLFSLIILIISVIVHEVSHGYAALFLGDPTAKYAGRLTLNPLKHIDPLGSIIVPIISTMAGMSFGWAKPVPINPYNFKYKRWGEAIVAFAGPASNIILFLIFSVVLRTVNLTDAVVQIFRTIILINLVLAIFNLVPVPPLDGSKILFGFLGNRGLRLRHFLETYQLLIAIVFIFFLWQFFEPFIIKIFFLLIGV